MVEPKVNRRGGRRHRRALVVALACQAAGACGTAGRQPPTGAARSVGVGELVVEAPGFRVDGLDPGPVVAGSNTFRARIHGLSEDTVTLGLDLRVEPGLWFPRAWQRQFVFPVPPGATVPVEVAYEVPRLTEETTLRVTVGRATRSPEGWPEIPEPAFRTRLPVGAGNPAAYDPSSDFEQAGTAHLAVLAWKGSVAASRVRALATEREAALVRLAEWLAVEPPAGIRVVLYPDSATKTEQTGHVGAGWARGRTIVEIHSADVQLDPYHELAHIVARALGDPPAALEEGLATYAAERMGADALRFLGSPGRRVDDVVCARRAELFPLPALLALDEIGTMDSRPAIAYPQAASFVKHIITRRGMPAFRALYAAAEPAGDPPALAANIDRLERTLQASIGVIEADWLASACAGEAGTP